jgi:hypothetical protein
MACGPQEKSTQHVALSIAARRHWEQCLPQVLGLFGAGSAGIAAVTINGPRPPLGITTHCGIGVIAMSDDHNFASDVPQGKSTVLHFFPCTFHHGTAVTNHALPASCHLRKHSEHSMLLPGLLVPGSYHRMPGAAIVWCCHSQLTLGAPCTPCKS